MVVSDCDFCPTVVSVQRHGRAQNVPPDETGIIGLSRTLNGFSKWEKIKTETNGFNLSSAADLLELSGRVVWLSFKLTFVCFSNDKMRQMTGACTLRFQQSFDCYRFYSFSRFDTQEPSTAAGWQKELRFVADFFLSVWRPSSLSRKGCGILNSLHQLLFVL